MTGTTPLRASLELTLALALTACAQAATQPPVSAPPQATASAAPESSAPQNPKVATAKRPVLDTYHGTSVRDDYRWLESDRDPEVKGWSRAQNAETRRVLDALPGRAAIEKRLKELVAFEAPEWARIKERKGRLFALKSAPPKQQLMLVRLKSKDSTDDTVVLDPTVLDASAMTSIDWYEPSPDGKLVAVSLSRGGSEHGTLHVFEVDTGKERAGERIERVQRPTGGGSLAWLANGKGFFYTRYPAPGERPEADLDFYQEAWFHALGSDPKSDQASLREGLPRIAEIFLSASEDGRYVLASVANGDGGDFEQWVMALGKDQKPTSWRKLAGTGDKVVEANFAPDGKLWIRSYLGAPRGKLLVLDPRESLDKAKTVVPESGDVIDFFAVTKTRLFSVDIVGGPHQVRVFDHAGNQLSTLAIGPATAVYRVAELGGDDVLLMTETFVSPSKWLFYDGKTGKLSDTALEKRPPASFDDVEVVRDTCTSRDGTHVPMTILRKKGTKLDGENPVVLTGYGGYGISSTPGFDERMRVWLDAGAVIADTNLRGGGEFGEAWHLAGNLTRKQNVFDDFLGCARHLINTGYTRPERLAIIGGSNGGLLMGAATVQAPELFKAVVSHVGLYDMLRSELEPNGEFNVTEFGSVKDRAQWQALYAYSPYHHVQDGARYPAVLFLTGENDGRVAPFQSRKMTARMQAAAPGGRILLRYDENSGHGAGTPLDQRIAQQVDVFSFLFTELGIALPN